MKGNDETLERIAQALSGASFGLRALAGQADSMGSVECLANSVREGLADVASAIRQLAEAISEGDSQRAGKRAAPEAETTTNPRSLQEAIR